MYCIIGSIASTPRVSSSDSTTAPPMEISRRRRVSRSMQFARPGRHAEDPRGTADDPALEAQH